MRMVNLAAVAAFAILAAGPALAGEPRGGGHPGGGGCGSGCGGHRPPAHGGGFNSNINVNVNANANANANAFAGAAAGGYFNARAYDVGGIRAGGHGGGTVYVGGGYGGDVGGYYGGGAIYNEEIYEGRACASAPFGYVVGGFGREGRRPPACVGEGRVICRGDDRGGRYGYSERRGCDAGRREDRHASHAESRGYYESHESYEAYESWSGGYRADHGRDERRYADDRRGPDCDCRADGAPRPPESHVYRPEPPAWTEPPAWRDAPPPPRHSYRQEPGERG